MASLVLTGDTSGQVTIAAPAVAGTTTLTLPATTGTVLNDATVGVCRAWVNFNGVSGSVAIRASFNVSSVTRNSLGDYTVTLTNAMSDANYSYLVGVGFASPAQYMLTPTLNAATGYTEVAPTTTTFRFFCINYNTSAYADPKYVNISVFR